LCRFISNNSILLYQHYSYYYKDADHDRTKIIIVNIDSMKSVSSIFNQQVYPVYLDCNNKIFVKTLDQNQINYFQIE
jgi:hypothetical protein